MIKPHGGKLINTILKGEQREKEITDASKLQKIIISEEQIKEVKNIARGLMSPLRGYMSKEDLESVVKYLKLRNGVIFPIPIFFATSRDQAKGIKAGQKVGLVNNKQKMIAVLKIDEKFSYNKEVLATHVFKTTDENHPGVRHLYSSGDVFLGGEIHLLDNSKEPYYEYNLDPKETRVLFARKGWKTIAGFQTRNVIHRGHEYLHRCVLEFVDGLFVNPVIGAKKSGDFKDELIIESYRTAIKVYYPRNKIVFSILPYQMRYAGPREAILHAIIRKNFGCTHFIVGRDHAGVGRYYDPYEAQHIFEEIGDLGITIVKIDEAFYCKKCVGIATKHTCGHSESERIHLSGTYIRSLIAKKQKVPEEIIRPEVSKLLQNSKDPFV